MTRGAWPRLGVGVMLVLAVAGGQSRGVRAQAGVGSPCRTVAGAADIGGSAPELPVRRSYSYRMAGRIRPLLFWITREGVGSGAISWRGSESGAMAYELLIGTEPAHAPRGINRWGYILEEVSPAETRVFGVISTDEEASLRDVNRGLDKGQIRSRFRAIEARITPGGSCSATGTIEAEREMTLHDASELANHVRQRLAMVAPKDVRVPTGVRPGFLTAVAELVGQTVKARRDGPAALRRLRGHTVAYVYGPNLLDLVLKDVEPAGSGPAAGKSGRFPLLATFEARMRTTEEHWRFELQYPTEGELAGVPTVIRHEPRWWLQVELVLDASKTPAIPTAISQARAGTPGRPAR